MNLLWITTPDVAVDRTLISTIEGFTIQMAYSGQEALALLSQKHFEAVLINSPILDYPPEALLEEIGRADFGQTVLVRSREGSVAEAVRCIKLGATHYLGPEVLGEAEEMQALQHALESAVRMQRLRRPRPNGPAGAVEEPWQKFLVGGSKAMRVVARQIGLVATKRSTVLITGETGTGKEMAARAIHMASSRSGQQMVAVNCSALPENLLEAELFGHVKGAFTGATGMRVGRFEEAQRGTLFLDEIADLPYGMQTKLLRVLQEKEIQRLGSGESIKVDFRLVAACNVNLEDKIRDGKFREDLYYRLNIIPLEMPSLRERREDIPLLVQHFLNKVCLAEVIAVKAVSGDTLERLCAQPWPGNVRQLENAVEMAVALSGDREMLYPADFRLPTAARIFIKAAPDVAVPQVSVPQEGIDFERVVGQFEKSLLDQAMTHTNGNKKQAAEILRLKRTTFTAKLKSLEAVAS